MLLFSLLKLLVLLSAGLGHEGIYRKNGAKSRIKLLMEEFRKDARNVKLRIGDHFIEDVTDVLKRFFREIDDPIFMADLHPLWQEAASESSVWVQIQMCTASWKARRGYLCSTAHNAKKCKN